MTRAGVRHAWMVIASYVRIVPDGRYPSGQRRESAAIPYPCNTEVEAWDKYKALMADQTWVPAGAIDWEVTEPHVPQKAK